MVRQLFVPLICSIVWAPASLTQIPRRIENCLPIPSLAQDIHQRNEESEMLEEESGRASAQPQAKLAKLIFRGQTALPLEQLKEIAKSLRERSYTDNPQWLDELLERIRDAWQHRGYFMAVVRDPLVRQLRGNHSEQRFAVIVPVDAGQLYHLERIASVHSTEFSSRELHSFFPIRDGDIFDTHKMQQGLEKMREAYGMKGFINMVAVPSFSFDERHAAVTMTLELDEGKQFRFGQIKVLGIDPLLAEKRLNESGLEPGRIFDTSLLGKFVAHNRDILPADAMPSGDTKRRIDEGTGTVDITMDVRGCPPLPEY